VIILNTGGTFNKRYDPIKGELIVPKDNRAVEEYLTKSCQNIAVRGLIYKDSLEFSDKDRQELLEAVRNIDGPVVIVHGTDTMDVSAQFLAKNLTDRLVVFTGAMVPFSIDPVEASANLTLAIAAARLLGGRGVYIAMHGLVAPYHQIYKNRNKGIFCLK